MKKIVTLLLALVVLGSLGAPALGAGGFTDVPEGHGFHEAILWCAGEGIVGGYADGSFRPGNTVTRSNFIVMLTRKFYPDEVARWDTKTIKSYMGTFGPNMAAANTARILTGTSFRNDYDSAEIMNKGINRYDMAQLMTNIMKAQGITATDAQKTAAQSSITDYQNIPAKYQDAVLNVYALGIIGGYGDGSFHGEGVMNREQAAAVIQRMVQKGASAVPAQPAEPTVIQTLANGKPITEENVTEILNELKNQYPHRTEFNEYDNGGFSKIRRVTLKQTWTGSSTTSTTRGCGGWSALVFDAIFGQDDRITFREVDFNTARPGDVVISVNDQGLATHVGIFTDHCPELADIPGYPEIFRTAFHTTDGTSDASGQYHINWDSVRFGDTSEDDFSHRFYTAYPD